LPHDAVLCHRAVNIIYDSKAGATGMPKRTANRI